MMTDKQRGAIIMGLLFFSILPVWRQAAGGRGLNLFQYFDAVILSRAGPEYYPHVTVEEAIENARRAYCEVKRLDYEASYSHHFVYRPFTLVAGRT